MSRFVQFWGPFFYCCISIWFVDDFIDFTFVFPILAVFCKLNAKGLRNWTKLTIGGDSHYPWGPKNHIFPHVRNFEGQNLSGHTVCTILNNLLQEYCKHVLQWYNFKSSIQILNILNSWYINNISGSFESKRQLL